MITLFVILVIATFVLAATRAEGMRPLGLALVGMICLVLGAQATALFTESSVAPLVNSMVFAQEANTDATASAATTEASTEAEATVSSRSSDDSDADDSDTDEADSDEADTDKAAADDATATAEASVPGTDVEPSLADTSEARELSGPVTVEAITNVNYMDRDDDSPQWLETKPWTEQHDHFVPVASQLQIEQEDVKSALQEQVNAATDAYINRLLKNKHATTLLKLRTKRLAPKIVETFEERVVVTAGTMHQTHALVKFDDSFRHGVRKEWDEFRATSRLMQTALGAGVVILLLSTMFSYFKLDTATRGYYTGRLQFAAAAAILAVVAVSVLFANYVPWM